MTKEEKKEVLTDHSGMLSSKRLWAFRWGNLAIIQIVIFLIYLVFNIVFANWVPPIVADLTPLLADVFKFTISTTIGASLLCLGLTVPEFFSKLSANSKKTVITPKEDDEIQDNR